MNRNKILLLTTVISVLTVSTVYAEWFALNSGTTNDLRSICFVDLQTGYSCGEFGTVVKTTNGGTNWNALNSGTSFNLRSIQFINANTGLSCGYNANNGIIIKTTNGGANWNSVYTGGSSLLSVTLFNSSAAICVGNSGTTLYSTNGGSSWLVGQPTGYLVTFYASVMLSSTLGYCGGVNTIFSPLFAKTTNGGAGWVYSSFMVNNNEATLMDMYFFNEQNGIAVSVLWNGQGGISRTTNGGGNWVHQIVTPALYGIDFTGASTGYIAGANGSVFKSTDGGVNWSAQTTPTAEFLRAIDFIDSLHGFSSGDNGVILKTTNGGVLGFSQISGEIPKNFALYQNYPNPFNPTTTIKFSIPLLRGVSAGRGVLTKLSVYDILGREIQTLVNENLSPGTYEVEFPARQSFGGGGDGTNLPSGVYYYSITAGDYNGTGKMILIK